MQYELNWKTSGTVDYKKSHIGYHGIFVTAWALTVSRLRKLKGFDEYEITAATHHFWVYYGTKKFTREAWFGICVNEKTKKIDLSAQSKSLVADRFYETIVGRLIELKRG